MPANPDVWTRFRNALTAGVEALRRKPGTGAGTGPSATASAADPTADPRKATTVGRAFAVAHNPGYQQTDHLAELQHMTSWVYPVVQKLGEAWGNATVSVYGPGNGYGAGLGKGFGANRVLKSFASDAPSEQRTPLPDHPVARLLRRPNPLKSGQAFLYQVACQLYLTGGYVIWEVRNQLGFPMELWVLPRGWLSYQQPSDQYPMGLWRVYPARTGGLWAGPTGPYAGGFYLDVRDTVVGGWPDPLMPGEFRSPLNACGQIIDITEKADQATWNLLVRAPRPSMILSADPLMTTEQIDQLNAHVEANKAGVHNAGLWMILQGVKPENTNPPLSDIDAVNVREQGKSFVHSVFGVPSILTGNLDGATYSGNAAAVNSFAENSVQPGLTLFGGDLTHRLQRYYGEGVCVELSAKRTDDPTIDAQKRDQMLAAYDKGVVTGNEVRAEFKLPPKEELAGLKAPEAPPGMVGPDGQPVAGAAPGGAIGGASDGATADDSDPFDLSPDLPDDDSTGTRNPFRRQPAGLNGKGHG